MHDAETALDFLFCRSSYTARASDPPPRLVLLDLALPKVGGLEVLRAIKEQARTRPIPVVMFASSNDERDVVRSYRLGANSYVEKPGDFRRFREVVRRLGLYWLTMNVPPPSEGFGEDGR